MIIQHNLPAMNSRRAYKKNASSLSKSLEKLSSGYKINRAGDDAAGLAVSEKMRSQICGMKQAIHNSQDGISLIQTFEGALGETVAIIHRAKTLADQMANGSYDDEVDRHAVEVEYLHLCDEVDQIAETDFNGVVMLTGGSVPQWLEDAVSEPTGSASTVTATANSATRSSVAATAANNAVTTAVSSYASVAPAVTAVSYAAAANRTGGVACGDFTVYGNAGDYSFDSTTGVLTILGGDVVVEGTGAATTNTVVVARDRSANVTLSNVNIDVSVTRNACAFKIENDSMGDVTVTLEGDNTLKSGENCAGLQKNSNVGSGTLTINGNGNLLAKGYGGAGVGGGYLGSCCGIVVNSGKITAIGTYGCAGIGSSDSRDAFEIYINGGEVVACAESGNGSEYDVVPCGAGIGSGVNGDCIGVYINGGVVKAVCNDRYSSGCGGAGIGGGATGIGKNIFIYNGEITAKGGDGASGVGGGCLASGEDIFIFGGEIIAEGGEYGAGIGGGWENGGYVFISGGEITAKGGEIAAGIGGGYEGTGTVVIEGEDTVVIAEGGTEYGLKADDIGSGYSGSDANVTINSPLISEAYSGGEIINGTIVHKKSTAPDDNPDKPIQPDESDVPEKMKVSIPNAFGNATAKLTYTDNLVLQVGARGKDAVRFTFAYDSDGIGGLAADLNCTAAGLGMDALTLSTQEDANFAIDRLDHALNKVSMVRSTFGAAQNRLEHKIDNLNNSTENLTSAESTIRDTDMAEEMMKFTKEQILSQAAQAMLAQANSLPQAVLSLISG